MKTNVLRKTLPRDYNAVTSICGKLVHKKKNCFDPNIFTLKTIVKAKRIPLIRFKHGTYQQNLQALIAVCSNA